MRVFVTGGSGFIGTALVRHLLSLGHEVAIFDKRVSGAFPDATIVGDVRDRTALVRASQGFQAIIHLAAEHRDDVRPTSLYFEVNVGGAENVVHAAEINGIAIVLFTSTVAVYGLDQPGATEQSPIRPFAEYGDSKAKAETCFKAWAGAGANRSLVILRPAVVFGERNRGNVFSLIDQIRKGRFVMVGTGENRKSMAYVRNIVEFMAQSLHFGSGTHLFNFADKPDLMTKELVEAVCRRLGKKPWRLRLPYAVGLAGGYTFDVMSALTGRRYPISSVRIRKFCSETVVATEALQAADYRARFTILEGLDEMIGEMLAGGADDWGYGEG